MLPNFLIIGAMKAGTTSLYYYLRGHPRVFMSDEKEIHFFNRDRNWEQGATWYERFFEGVGDVDAVGEASPGYSMYPHRRGVPERIASLMPNVRLIYVIRDPIDRMRSHYAHRQASGSVVLPIDEELLENPLYLDMSRYALQIEQYLDHFGRDQLLVVVSEDLRSDRAATMATVFTFLGVDPEFPVRAGEFHRTAQKRTRTTRGRFLGQIPGYELARRLSPAGVKKRFYRALTTPTADPALLEISSATRSALEAELRSDIMRLCDHLAVPEVAAWGIA